MLTNSPVLSRILEPVLSSLTWPLQLVPPLPHRAALSRTLGSPSCSSPQYSTGGRSLLRPKVRLEGREREAMSERCHRRARGDEYHNKKMPEILEKLQILQNEKC